MLSFAQFFHSVASPLVVAAYTLFSLVDNTYFLMTVDPVQIGQAVLGILIGIGYWAQWRSGKQAKVKQEEIHVLVNSRLSEALEEIQSLKRRIDAKDKVIADQTVGKD